MGSIPIVGSCRAGRDGRQAGGAAGGGREGGGGRAARTIGSGGGSPTPGGYPSGQRGLTVNQLADAFGGSNPSPPTGKKRSAVSGQQRSRVRRRRADG